MLNKNAGKNGVWATVWATPPKALFPLPNEARFTHRDDRHGVLGGVHGHSTDPESAARPMHNMNWQRDYYWIRGGRPW